MKTKLNLCIYINTAVMITLSLYFFLIPACILIYDFNDPGLCSNKMPHCVFRWHKSLSPKYEKWAKKRMADGAAAGLNNSSVSGTEWPLFGSVFYLWATESLQESVDRDPTLSDRKPKDYARAAIKAATALVVDPDQATWVKEYWGKDYLTHKNLFYRMMLISAMTTYEKLIGDNKYIKPLRNQVESLAMELDNSPFGLLEDYPGYTYPVDIAAAIAAIKRADSVLHTDHSEFVKRALRGFQDSRLHKETQLPGYLANARTGEAIDCARGIGLSFMLIWAPELWPDTAHNWYQKYEDQYWQKDYWFCGFREYPRDIKTGWLQINDPDAGPVIKGFGTAACAFGIPASRAQSRYDHTYALTTQALAVSWPLPDGSLLGPRLMSNFTEAPYLGEAVMMFALSRNSLSAAAQINQKSKPAAMPRSVYMCLLFYTGIGLYEITSALWYYRRWFKLNKIRKITQPKIQFIIWCMLMVLSLIIYQKFHALIALIPLLIAQIIPRLSRQKAMQ